MRLEQLLQLLADGRFSSGEELGRRLGVSRNAVCKQLKKLDDLGVPYYSVRGRGYRIPGGLDLLDASVMQSQLISSAQSSLKSVDLCLCTDSTNAQALAGISQGKSHGCLYLAESQQAGRGRRGRVWVSPFARNLYLSLVWTFTGGAAALEGLSLAVGLAIVRGLEDYGVVGLGLKWPNDILVNDRKLAGILLEMVGDASGLCHVVIGVGVNVSMPREDGAEIGQPWTDVEQLMATNKGTAPEDLVSRNALLASLINRLLPALDVFSTQGFEPFRKQWLARDAFAGRPVSLLAQNEQIDGIAAGVDASGALLMETGQGQRAFHGGELSLRLRQ